MRGKQDHSRERVLRRDQTDAERVLWQHLRNRALLDHRFRRQHKVGSYIDDFACPEAFLVIELDGSQYLDLVDSDTARTGFLQGLGYRVVSFWNDGVLLRIDDVLHAIVEALGRPDEGRSARLQA